MEREYEYGYRNFDYKINIKQGNMVAEIVIIKQTEMIQSVLKIQFIDWINSVVKTVTMKQKVIM